MNLPDGLCLAYKPKEGTQCAEDAKAIDEF